MSNHLTSLVALYCTPLDKNSVDGVKREEKEGERRKKEEERGRVSNTSAFGNYENKPPPLYARPGLLYATQKLSHHQ
jgi:hypothetical protein